MDLGPIMARLKAGAPSLRAVEDALSFAELVRAGIPPQQSMTAFVIPLGQRGGEASAVSGAYVQPVDHVIGVVLIIATRPTVIGGESAGVDAVLNEVIAALAGWGPNDVPGVMTLRKAELLSLSAGIATYQIDFVLEDQLRVTP